MKKIDNPQIVNFDTKKIRLKEIFYEIFLEQNIQKIIEKNSNEKIYKSLYSSFNEIKFQKIYRLLLKEISNFLKLDNFFFKKYLVLEFIVKTIFLLITIMIFGMGMEKT
tara:strand:- start:286 stop:612 length:327 start_codon:yes stop_codon:yes gene_type:complete